MVETAVHLELDRHELVLFIQHPRSHVHDLHLERPVHERIVVVGCANPQGFGRLAVLPFELGWPAQAVLLVRDQVGPPDFDFAAGAGVPVVQHADGNPFGFVSKGVADETKREAHHKSGV